YLCLLRTSSYTPNATLFPYTTLFRSPLRLSSVANARVDEAVRHVDDHVDQHVHGGHEQDRALDQRKIFGQDATDDEPPEPRSTEDRKSTRLNSSHDQISYAVFCLKKK